MSPQREKINFLISAGIRKNSPDGAMHPDNLTERFADDCKDAGIASDAPTTFHEITVMHRQSQAFRQPVKAARRIL
ncbi:hypothetical protein J2X14_001116 [Pantoea alhagi]|uniref:hypothetical protein n=1 Tax=Mixta sp. BE291 TaxID=3158787 RepID=UPI0028596200|nr:hypothetical protein [Pantoea alhagi]